MLGPARDADPQGRAVARPAPRGGMSRLGPARRFLIGATPFVAIALAFAAAVGWHLGAPRRQADDFARRLAAAGETGQGVGGGDFLQLVRTPCRGDCPAYTVRLHADGRVDFDGWRNVCNGQPAPPAIDPVTARRLIAAAVGAGYLDWPEPGLRVPPGSAVASLELHLGGAIRRLSFAQGRPDDPPQLAAVAQALETATGVARWLPDSAGICTGPDGRRWRFDERGEPRPIS